MLRQLAVWLCLFWLPLMGQSGVTLLCACADMALLTAESAESCCDSGETDPADEASGNPCSSENCLVQATVSDLPLSFQTHSDGEATKAPESLIYRMAPPRFVLEARPLPARFPAARPHSLAKFTGVRLL